MTSDVNRRQFVKNLGRAGTAAQIRESVSHAIRESSYTAKPLIVDPLDYETAIVKNKTLLYNDPHRDMLLFPQDDVSSSVVKRKFHTAKCSVPSSAPDEAKSLFVKECIKTYTADWNVVKSKYNRYGGTYLQLPRAPQNKLIEQHFEVDCESRDDESATTNALKANVHQITKQGWLYKCPDNQAETSGLFTRVKRRYFYLKQQQDTTYALEFHKDDKKLESKGTIFLDSAVSVHKSSKKGRYAFEIHMSDGSFYTLATDIEQELDEWIKTLKKVIVAESHEKKSEVSKNESNGGEENLMPPELAKYARETESYVSQLRKTNRQRIFTVYPELPKYQYYEEHEEEVDIYVEQFNKRLVVTCEEFRTKLQGNIAEDGDGEIFANPEPFFITLALYDASRKISEDFHYDPNSVLLRAMIPKELRYAYDKVNNVGHDTAPESHVSADWLSHRNKFILSVRQSGADAEVYLVAKVEKVLQGGISSATDPYIKSTDPKLGTKVHKHMRQCCSRIGNYRMPFAWGARPIFTAHGDIDLRSNFTLYKQESTKVSELELLRHLQDIHRPDKQGKWQVIPALFRLKIEPYIPGESPISNILTPSLVPVAPFANPVEQGPTVEVQEFLPDSGECSYPYNSYVNNLYVYPKLLKYDNQKTFAKARNIACCVELRDSDAEDAVSLRRIFGRPGGNVFTSLASSPVLHHNDLPEFYEELKINLPTQLHDKHHLLFTFYHVSCEMKNSSSSRSGTGKNAAEAPVGYAWLPLLSSGRVSISESNLKVSTTLPPKYLYHESLGLGKGFTGPEIKWVDNGKQIFTVDLRLVSTVYSTDPHLNTFFQHCEKKDPTPTPALEMETINKLKALLAVHVSVMIEFLPTLLNQLFSLFTHTYIEDVALNTLRVLIHVVSMVHSAKKKKVPTATLR